MGASAAILFPYFGEAAVATGAEAAAAAGTEALAAGAAEGLGVGALETAALTNSFVDPALFAAGSAAVDPEILSSIAAGTFEYAAPALAEAATAAGGLASSAVDAGLASDLGTSFASPYSAAANLAGTGATDTATAALSGAPSSALAPLSGTGTGTVASTLAPSAEAASSILPITQLSEEELAAQGGSAFTAAPQAASQAAQVGAEATTPLASQAAQAGTETASSLASQAGSEYATSPLAEQAAQGGSAFTTAPQPLADQAAQGGSAFTTAPQPTAPLPPVKPSDVSTVKNGVDLAATKNVATATDSPYTLGQANAPIPTMAQAPLTPEVPGSQTLAGTSSQYAATAPTAVADAAGSGFNVGSFLKDYGSLALGGAGLAYNMLKGNQKPEYQASIEAAAKQMAAQGAQLQGYLTSGTLPPGMNAALASAHSAAEATIRSRYATMGMSGSSAEMNDLSNLAYTTVAQGATIASQLLQTGVNESQYASGLYQNLMANSMAQDTAMSNAVAGFTNAMAGGFSRKPNPVG